MPSGIYKRKERRPKTTAINRQTKRAISVSLGISRTTLDRYLLMADAPKPDRTDLYNMGEVVTFINTKKGEGKLSAMQEAKFRREVANARIAEAEAEEMEGGMIKKEDIAKELVPLIQEIGDLIAQEFELNLPYRYQGLTAPQCVEINAAARDRIVKRFREGTTKYTAKDNEN